MTRAELIVEREQLLSRNQYLECVNQQLQAKVSWFEEQFKLTRARAFGSSSESTSEVSQGVLVFNEAEAAFDSARAEAETEKITYT